MRKIVLTLLLILLPAVYSLACTSVIVSSKVSSDGRPIMLKHRDSGCLDSHIEYFKGEKYNFIALVDDNARTEPQSSVPFKGTEIWTGTNSEGFCIMNTATYDLKDDDVPSSLMDREGQVMYMALSKCRELADFEKLLDGLERPIGVEANFGVIDAHGGAAYYEVNNSKWVKFDVNALPEGYMVVTNFTRTGRKEDRKGVDRYEYVENIMKSSDLSKIDHKFIFSMISRSGAPVLRDISSSSTVYEGVRNGENPLHTVMWTALGYPVSAVYVPLMVVCGGHVPSFLKQDTSTGHALMCSNSLYFKDNGLNVTSKMKQIENVVDRRFESMYERWKNSKMTNQQFLRNYDVFMDKVLSEYKKVTSGIVPLDKNN